MYLFSFLCCYLISVIISVHGTHPYYIRSVYTQCPCWRSYTLSLTLVHKYLFEKRKENKYKPILNNNILNIKYKKMYSIFLQRLKKSCEQSWLRRIVIHHFILVSRVVLHLYCHVPRYLGRRKHSAPNTIALPTKLKEILSNMFTTNKKIL
jgi:hypothetical protein